MPTSPLHAQHGVAFVISAPSGGGKTTLCQRLTASMGNLSFSISHTTRQPRAHEADGRDYHFVDRPSFEELVRQDAFVEWAEVHDRLYGTSRAAVEGRLAEGRDILFEIDVQGGKQIAAKLPHVALIFIVPPSMAILGSRLRGRQSDAAGEIDRRLAAAASEISQAAFYTHWIVNDDLERAVAALQAIVVAERLRCRNKALMCQQILAGQTLA
jgi:guanylate kinase